MKYSKPLLAIQAHATQAIQSHDLRKDFLLVDLFFVGSRASNAAYEADE